MRKRKRRPKLNTTTVENGHFFPAVQKKLAIGNPGDAYELEANRVADTVTYNGENAAVQKKESKEEIQQKPLADSISSLQKKELPLGEELAQKTEAEEEPVQAMEEEEPIQAMEEEEPVQALEEEEPVQAMEEEEVVQAKSKPSKTSPRIETLLKETKGKGQKLSTDIMIEMNKNFGEDFSDVKIHTNDDAIKMCEELRAQAFTNGTDIYFNEGKYNPDSVSGKHLLAHELTHIIQQNK